MELFTTVVATTGVLLYTGLATAAATVVAASALGAFLGAIGSLLDEIAARLRRGGLLHARPAV